MRAHIAYLKYVLRHKWFVFLWCMRIGCIGPVRAILHDWDKFLPDEWFAYVNTFYNPDGSKQYKEGPEFALAWRLHQIRNKHHWQYWLLTWDRGETVALPMPHTHIYEMVADWQGAGQAITGKADSRGWYEKNKEKMILHPKTRAFVEYLLSEFP